MQYSAAQSVPWLPNCLLRVIIIHSTRNKARLIVDPGIREQQHATIPSTDAKHLPPSHRGLQVEVSRLPHCQAKLLLARAGRAAVGAAAARQRGG